MIISFIHKFSFKNVVLYFFQVMQLVQEKVKEVVNCTAI